MLDITRAIVLKTAKTGIIHTVVLGPAEMLIWQIFAIGGDAN